MKTLGLYYDYFNWIIKKYTKSKRMKPKWIVNFRVFPVCFSYYNENQKMTHHVQTKSQTLLEKVLYTWK